MPAKAEGIAQGRRDGRLARLIGHIVEIALRVGVLQGGGRRHDAVPDGLGQRDRFQTTRRWSMPSELGRKRWLSSMAASSELAEVIAWKSPVKCRLMSSMGTTCE